MQKQHTVLCIQDLSCVGRCSLAVVLPALAAMGVQPCALPTALLSTHTGGFGKPAVVQLGEQLAPMWRHWQENGITFDGVIGVSAGAIHGCSFVSGQALPVSAQSLALDMPACLLITIVALLPLLMKEKGSKIQGLSLILSYSLYLFFVCSIEKLSSTSER